MRILQHLLRYRYAPKTQYPLTLYTEDRTRQEAKGKKVGWKRAKGRVPRWVFERQSGEQEGLLLVIWSSFMIRGKQGIGNKPYH
jgi:hypothetical protein